MWYHVNTKYYIYICLHQPTQISRNVPPMSTLNSNWFANIRNTARELLFFQSCHLFHFKVCVSKKYSLYFFFKKKCEHSWHPHTFNKKNSIQKIHHPKTIQSSSQLNQPSVRLRAVESCSLIKIASADAGSDAQRWPCFSRLGGNVEETSQFSARDGGWRFFRVSRVWNWNADSQLKI